MSAHTRRSPGFTLVELPVVSTGKRAAFTLVELLVVIAIIGTLVALLLPAVQSARENARKLECLSNQGELGKAMIAYGTSRGKLPGYAQVVQRDRGVWVAGAVNPANGRVVVVNTPDDPDAIEDAWGVSWAAILLPNLERQDIWEQLVDPNVDPNVTAGSMLEVRPIDLFICPSDTDLTSQVDLPGLSYSVNTGAWDRDEGFEFLYVAPNSGEGDTTDNGVFSDAAAYQRDGRKPLVMRIEKINDGAATTIMLTENSSKNYEQVANNNPLRFTWLGGHAEDGFGTEQQLGVTWIVDTNPPQPQEFDLNQQERINKQTLVLSNGQPAPFNAIFPTYARPASKHVGGVNVVFMDGHGQFLREDIDYIVYQQLLTSNGRKCVDPQNWDAGVNPVVTTSPIYNFRIAPPLAEEDYQ